ncbi:GTP-binding protein [Thalassobacillus sp. C254]|uniref:GTP-binding protein n=1 Tax=Thalassobacillus sp. C254 TaxID=1225341 RepID=UPI0035B554CC
MESVHSYSYQFEGLVNRERFEEFLATLKSTVLRAKGFIPFEDGTHLFQYTPTNFTFNKLDWSVSSSKIVLIGTSIDKEKIGQSIKECEVIKVNN